MCYGPVENSQVAHYRMALEKFPLVLHCKNWSEAEKKSLQKGIRQQFQEMAWRLRYISDFFIMMIPSLLFFLSFSLN